MSFQTEVRSERPMPYLHLQIIRCGEPKAGRRRQLYHYYYDYYYYYYYHYYYYHFWVFLIL